MEVSDKDLLRLVLFSAGLIFISGLYVMCPDRHGKN